MLEFGIDDVAEGSFTFLGTVHLNGRLEGSIVCDTLVVGRAGLLEGDAYAEQVILEGQIIGTVTARNIELRPGAILEGDVIHEQLSMEATASLTGASCRKARVALPDCLKRLKDRHKQATAELETLHAEHVQRQAEVANRAWLAYKALRERFPFPATRAHGNELHKTHTP